MCTYWGTCRKCGKFGHGAKESSNIPMSINQSSNIQNQPAVNSSKNSESGSQILKIYALNGFQIPKR